MKSILIIGRPGQGKSLSLFPNEHIGVKGLDPKETFIIKPNNKLLPFPNGEKVYNVQNKNLFITNKLSEVGPMIDQINTNAKHVKTIVLEDLTHFLSRKVMDDSHIKGFDKWNEFASLVYQNIIKKEAELRSDLTVIVIGHVEEVYNDEGAKETQLLTPGKLLDKLVKIDSFFTYILHTDVINKKNNVQYRFLTNRNGSGKLAKSPPGCLELFEPNDCGLIIDKINKYHGIN